MTNFSLKPMGSREVLLEFNTKEDMEFTLKETKGLLAERFEWFSACPEFMTGKSHLM